MTNRRDFLKYSLSVAVLSSLPASAHAFSGYGLNRPVPVRSFESGGNVNVFSSKDYFEKIRNFNKAFNDDLIASSEEFSLVKSCQRKTHALMRYVGFGNFNILNFDDALAYMKNTASLKAFTKAELDYIDMLFARDASAYGFYGEKIFNNLTDRVNADELIKVSGSGHYVYKHHSLSTYKNILQR